MKGLGNLKSKVQLLTEARTNPLPAPEATWGQGRGGRPWRRKRDRILARDKYLCQCEDCQRQGLLTPADEVDHITPQSQGGSEEDDNLRAINHDCHAKKTALESQAGRRG